MANVIQNAIDLAKGFLNSGISYDSLTSTDALCLKNSMSALNEANLRTSKLLSEVYEGINARREIVKNALDNPIKKSKEVWEL